MQLLKQIWNERRSNIWLGAELVIVFVALWYVIDWGYMTARTYYEPVGFDITDTYYIELGLKNEKSSSYMPKEKKTTTLGEDLLELTDRLRRLPEVEAVSISQNSRPYIGSNSSIRLRIDTLTTTLLRRPMQPEFFRVFRYQSIDGQGYRPLMQALENGKEVVGDNFLSRSYPDTQKLGLELTDADDSTEVYRIGAISQKVRYNDFWPNYSDRYMAYAITEKMIAQMDADYYPYAVEVCLRVHPGTPADFAKRLMDQSATGLSVGNLFILKVHDYDDIRNDFQQDSYNEVRIHLWMIAFLLLNILLGIVGTFWFRTQHRRAESALRLALGSGRMQLWGRLNREGLLLLTLAVLPAAVICYNLGYFELTEISTEWGILRFLITTVIAYLLMALMVLAGIWFPARQVVRIQPAEALREE